MKPKPNKKSSWFSIFVSFVLFLISGVSILYLFLRRSNTTSGYSNPDPSRLREEKPAKKTKGEIGLPITRPNFLLPVGALAFSGVGQFLLQKDQSVIGAVFIGLASVLFVLTFWRQPGLNIQLASMPWIQRPNRERSSWIGGILIGLSVLLAGLAFWLFGTDIPASIPWLLHIFSIALFIASAYWINKYKIPVGIEEINGKKEAKWTWLEIVVFSAIIVIAIFMRVYRLDQIPFGTWYDEADNGLTALKIITEPGYLPVFATTLPAHYLYIIAFFFRILGISTISMRAASVVFGVATVGAAFFAGKELFDDRRLGFVAAFFLAASRWDINWSRIAMHDISVPFFELISVGLILRSLRRQNLMDYCLAGIALGLGICFYTPLRLFPLVICIFLLYLWIRRKGFARYSWRGLLILILGIFIASVPISQFMIQQPETFFNRMEATSIFTGKSTLDAWKAIAETTRQHLLMFNYQGDRNGRHNLPGEPMLDPISGVLLFLGVAFCLWRIRQPGAFLLIIWLVLMLTPGIFSLDFEAPQSLRAIGSMPAAYLLAVVPIQILWRYSEQFSDNRTPTFAIPLVIVLFVMGAINYHIYFDLQANSFDSWSAFSTPETIIGKKMAELGPQVVDYVSIFYYNSPTVQFLTPGITTSHSLQTYDSLPISVDGKDTVAFFVDADRKQFFLQAKRYYPNADFTEYKGPDGTVVLYQIILKPTDIQAAQGITVSYYQNEDWSAQSAQVSTKSGISADWVNGTPTQFPFGVVWQGVVYAEQYGIYQLILHSPLSSELIIDNVEVPLVGTDVQTATVELAKGSHELILKTRVEKEGHFELDWRPPGQEPAPIPTVQLFLPPITNNGLLGKYYQNGNWQSPPAFTEIDPWIHFYYQNQPLQRPYTVEWTGKINITTSGHYLFGLECIDDAELYVDNEKVLSVSGTDQYVEGGITLSAGFHSIRLRYADRTGYTHINLYWTPPNSEKESIPQDALFLP